MMIAVDKVFGTGDIFKKMGDVPYEQRENRNSVIFTTVLLLQLVYSIFLPLKSGTGWIYVGLAIYLLGLAMFLTALTNVAATPPGQPFTKGMYRYSRHPTYVSGFIIQMGVSVASASWIFFLLSIVSIVLLAPQAVAEERVCLETYGDKYYEYLNRTPRWIGMPKSN
jgi:protein-S-isoprenylcysteine O-methyltransferase Ste14